ncbi:hypothetical protein K490DRAFT_59943 [Saccharata proteae CBS 121410]|uniref:Uncharacterized protein n=1 Tax=Saccharata proteae CBS 121410 TaxID=1314787 RepID=A0A9P4LWI7_9PEZI|nr:hypothetical protein K490DRAFT_59943 [Saccharata proteae CBS 121410]
MHHLIPLPPPAKHELKSLVSIISLMPSECQLQQLSLCSALQRCLPDFPPSPAPGALPACKPSFMPLICLIGLLTLVSYCFLGWHKRQMNALIEQLRLHTRFQLYTNMFPGLESLTIQILIEKGLEMKKIDLVTDKILEGRDKGKWTQIPTLPAQQADVAHGYPNVVYRCPPTTSGTNSPTLLRNGSVGHTRSIVHVEEFETSMPSCHEFDTKGERSVPTDMTVIVPKRDQAATQQPHSHTMGGNRRGDSSDEEILALARDAVEAAQQDANGQDNVAAQDQPRGGITIDLRHRDLKRLPDEVVVIIKDGFRAEIYSSLQGPVTADRARARSPPRDRILTRDVINTDRLQWEKETRTGRASKETREAAAALRLRGAPVARPTPQRAKAADTCGPPITPLAISNVHR